MKSNGHHWSPAWMGSLVVLAMPAMPVHAEPVAAAKVVYTQEQSTVDGTPFLPKGIFGVNPPEFARVAGYGFNLVQSYQLSSMTDDEVAGYLDAARDHGLKVLFHLGAAVPTPEIQDVVKRRVQRFKDHPGLYGWYLADEPSVQKIKAADLISLYRWIKAADPSHPVFSSNWELKNFKDACDVDMPQLYSGPPSGLRTGALPRQMRLKKELGMPWIAIANTHDTPDFNPWSKPGAETLSPAFFTKTDPAANGLPPMDPEAVRKKMQAICGNLQTPPFKSLASYPDSPLKIRGQALDMIAHGSNGIFYWLLQPEDTLGEKYGYYTIFVRPPLREALKDVLKEIEELWPYIGDPARDSRMWYESEFGNLFYWSRRQGNRMVVIAVNESESDWLTTSTELPDLKNHPEASARLSRENRTLKLKNGVLTDTFRSNQAHVYLIDLK